MKKIITIALLAVASVASSVSAEGMGVIAGTTGFGIEVASPLSKNWNFRLHVTGGNFDKAISIIHPHAGSFPVDIQYDADLELINIGALVDWYPGGSIFRVTAGNFYTKRKFNVTALLKLMVPIGYNAYTSIEAGSVTGFIKTENLFSPYFGIGLGKKADSDDGLDVSIDFGMMYTYTGSPKVSLTADGLLASDPTFMSDLAEEERIISSSKYFKVYPVMSIGITYKF
jgi:hypothetical protein